MIRIARQDRPWIIGGIAMAGLLTLLVWFFVISPQHGQTAGLYSQADAAQAQNAVLTQRLSTLRAQNANLAQFKANLAHDQAALPSTSDMPALLRELQAVGASTLVNVSAVTVGTPTAVGATAAAATATPSTSTSAAPAAPSVYSIAITVTASGSGAALAAFLDQLQTVQPRAVLISQANLAPSSKSGSLAAGATLQLSLAVFVASK